MGQLAAGMAHEINNPIGFIISNLNTFDGNTEDLCLLLEHFDRLADFCRQPNSGPADGKAIAAAVGKVDALRRKLDLDFMMDDTRALVAESLEGARRIKTIVQNLREFAHPGVDKPETVNVNHCLDITLSMLENRIGDGIDITRKYKATRLVTCYLRDINQVFFNVIQNAVQAVGQSGKIVVSTCDCDDNSVEIAVGDTGAGIPEAHLNHIYDPFFTTRDVGGGTGLGLYLVFTLVKKHDGRHQCGEQRSGRAVFSGSGCPPAEVRADGVGDTMSRLANLFLNQGDGQSAASAESRPDAADQAVYTVLFIDDEVNVLKAMQRIFRQENYRLLTAESGMQALGLMKEQQPVHVVVSDFRMPGMNGADVLKQVKKNWPNTIRIMLTGYADVDAVMGAVNDGAVYKFITKPWNDDDIRLTVSLALEQYDLITENERLKKQSASQKSEIKRLSHFVNTHRSQLGKLLAKQQLITREVLDKALAIQARTNSVLPKVLANMGALEADAITAAIERFTEINRVSPAEFSVPEALAALIPREICEKNLLVPLKRNEQKLIVAMADPTDFMKIDDLAFITGMPVQPVVAGQKEILDKIKEIFGESDQLEKALTELDLSDPTEQIEIILDEEDEDSDIEQLIRDKDKPPAIRIVNAIVADALRHGASDVHIEPKAKHVMVRYRMDDLLVDKLHIPLQMHLAIVSRIKVMSELDISERRRPQDGRITIKSSTRMVDMRISTLPTINGEKVVLRILDKNAASKSVEELGFSAKDLAVVRHFVERPQGIILTTGPTGSGKTTTLYGLLRHGAKITKNFTTIEDPVEYHMTMAEQVNVREKIGLTFSNVLRSILRQDPNVIMLGEIRDHETAEVAFHAALTGHLVLSTLHTNSSIASITRLRDMGLESYVIADALLGVVAQRLVRKICPDCRAEDRPDASVLCSLRITDRGFVGYKGTGCEKCNNSGYKGRIGVYEVFQVDAEIKRMIHQGATEPELLHAARLTGMKTLLDDAVEKLKKGVTTCEEILRVFGPQNIAEIACPFCRSLMEQRYHFCPYCGRELVRTCPDCGRLLTRDWRHCPQCGILVPERAVAGSRQTGETMEKATPADMPAAKTQKSPGPNPGAHNPERGSS